MDWQKKKQKLENRMNQLCTADVCLAFSGGVDSSLLLSLAGELSRKHGTKVYAVTFDTQLHPAVDVEIAREIAKECETIHHVIFVDEFSNPSIMENPINRCYLCKKMLFEKLLEFAGEKGIPTIMEGSNEDDTKVYRPGLQAVKELEVLSPLMECGFTKEEVRTMARERGVAVSNRPSTPCLATRLPYGTKIQRVILKKIEQGEAYLKELGFYNVRMRVHKDVVRLEVDEESFHQLLLKRRDIIEKIKSMGFAYVSLDLEGFRSGSMDEKIK